MESNNNKNITRTKFIKGIAGAAVCCACFPIDSFVSAQENSKQDREGKEHLAAVCGTFCGACPAYIAKHSDEKQKQMRLQKKLTPGPMTAKKSIPDPRWMDGLLCDGCLSDGEIAPHCQKCPMKVCAASKQNVTRCSDCKELPCNRIMGFINTGLLHRAEYLPNLEKIRKMGVLEWVKYEEDRWRCPKCGLPMSWYDAECVSCGAPRSGILFPL